ncbi:LuxR C-terminal-related transcriptional regulator [Nocardiopsis exhalans]|uniref:LuxR C-terminal-related transcriptional regulator n=1 Tax=Nocardiopsis exhalans TaxID=163604 RepID=A0ABY5D523_9ACTN|nr:LuxR C-terminal-related transcriptional regulator [Nocardiopsis exhalans]USY19459.1 LuxR C-terminal-related transcriptional regulator [Nocardiopsis exhalans]
MALEWSGPEDALTAAVALVRAPLTRSLPTLSEVLAEVLPHRALIVLTGDCSEAALRTHGDPGLTDLAEPADLVALAAKPTAGTPWTGRAEVAGDEYPVLVAASSPDGSAGTLLTAVLPDSFQEPEPALLGVVQHLWDLTTLHVKTLNAATEPDKLSRARLVSSERDRAIAELTDAQGAALTGVLGVLRSRGLDDTTARRTATDLAASALVDLRAHDGRGDLNQGTESLDEAFSTMADKLLVLMRHHETALELVRPSRLGGHPLPAEMADAARAAVRRSVLTMLEQPGVRRIRVSWEVEESALTVTVRDDGPGQLGEGDLGLRGLRAGLDGLGARPRVEAVPGWGTTISARLPLVLPEAGRGQPVRELNPREAEVLQHLDLGRRNRQIAERLNISEHTVKYHVANILEKLGAGSRGEAAATARNLGLVPRRRGTAS